MFAAWGVSVGIPLPIAFAGSLGIGLVVGAVNGTIISKARINPLITTLATLSIVRGISYVLSGGKDIVLTDPTWLWLGSGSVMGIPFIVIVLVATFVVFGAESCPARCSADTPTPSARAPARHVSRACRSTAGDSRST